MGMKRVSVVSDSINLLTCVLYQRYHFSIILEQDFVRLHLGLQKDVDGGYIDLGGIQGVEKHVCLRPDTPLNEYLLPCDLAIVHHTFMDSRKVLHDLGVENMPTLTKPGQAKLSTKQSND